MSYNYYNYYITYINKIYKCDNYYYNSKTKDVIYIGFDP